ncbi:MAG: hypothetical protein AMXMBFR53_22160 [Gemmatimonadota bacterium]
MNPTGRTARIAYAAVWVVSALLALQHLDRGWLAHDEGTLAQSAERVLLGELPHRDFDELYTGGLSYLNAAAFRVLGVDLLAPRLVLFAFFLAWIPAVLYVTTRFAPWPLASLATVLAAAWSIPNYPAAMPSWYNLFFACFGLAAFLRHLETGALRWLFVAGLTGGASVAVKSSGLFFVAAGLLFLAHREQELSAEAVAGTGPGPAAGDRWFRVAASALHATFAALLVLLVGGRAGASGALRFILPLGALAVFLLAGEWTGVPRGPGAARWRRLLRLGLPFAGGVLLPVGALAVVYAAHGALGDLARGLFSTPTRRLAFASTPPPGLATLWVVVPLLAVLAADHIRRAGVRQGIAGLVLLGGVAVALAPGAAGMLPPVWNLLNALGPLVAVAGVVALILARRRHADALARQQLLAALAVAGGVVLIQFPFAGPIYLFYALPALVPAALALGKGRGLGERLALASVMGFLLLFTVRWVNTGVLFVAGGFPFDPGAATETLALPRAGGLKVSAHDKEQYEVLIPAMQELSRSEYTFATPDLPEVYFLSGLRNPTRTLFDFFAAPEGRTADVLERLEAHRVDVVVLNLRLRFSGPPPEDLVAELEARYPKAARVGDFILRWREPAPAAADGGGGR